MIWLKRGIDPEETNGHVDDVACFVRPGVVLAGWTDDESDWRHEVLAENLDILRNATDAKGRKFEVHTHPNAAAQPYSAEEVAGVDAVEGTIPREEGDEPRHPTSTSICATAGSSCLSSTTRTTPRRSRRFALVPRP